MLDTYIRKIQQENETLIAQESSQYQESLISQVFKKMATVTGQREEEEQRKVFMFNSKSNVIVLSCPILTNSKIDLVTFSK